MVYLIIFGVGAAALAAYLAVRLWLLRCSLGHAERELREITGQIGENRILRMETPEPKLEALLAAVNDALKQLRAERISYDRREKEFQRQIENISHDLRTPLTAILGYLKLMDLENLSEEEREDLQIVCRKAESMRRLVSQFYDYSRAVSPDYVPQQQRVDLSRYVRETMLEYYADIEVKERAALPGAGGQRNPGETEGRFAYQTPEMEEDSGFRFECELPDAPVLIQADEAVLHRVLDNLVQNALRYGTSFFRVCLSQEKESVCLVFENDVQGMKAEDLEPLFQRFYVKDAARSRSADATGLGLAIAQSFTEKLGGTLTAELPQEGILRFTVRFPEYRAD